MARTPIRFLDSRTGCETEADAYVWMLDQFMRGKGDFFAKGIDRSILTGRSGATYFATASTKMRQPRRLSNNWFVETGLSDRQKRDKLWRIAQWIGVSSERDFEWKADGQPPASGFDVSGALDDLDRL